MKCQNMIILIMQLKRTSVKILNQCVEFNFIIKVIDVLLVILE